MRLISHRGNLVGPSEKENEIEQLRLVSKFMLVETDVWSIDGNWFLGHDEPKTLVSQEFLTNQNFILHAKNLEALNYLTATKLHYFWHQNDDFTLTSKNFIWTYPHKDVTTNSIIVCQTRQEVAHYKLTDAWGICTDYVKDTH